MRTPHAGGPARQAGMREHNSRVVLDHVLRSAVPISRARLASATGLTRATVSAIVDDLIRATLIAESGRSQTGAAGRPSIGLVAHPSGPVAIGLEINVDQLAVCAVDLTGQVTHEAIVPADQRGVAAVTTIAHIAELAADAVTAMSAVGRPAVGAALAVPGLVGDHLVRVAPNLGWHDVPVPDTIAGLRLSVDNEANYAAQGELAAGGAHASDFVYVSGEIGIGAGVVLGGQLMRGAKGFAGELGHVAVRPDGPRCECGAYGCLEQYAGQDAIVRAALAPRRSDSRKAPADSAPRRSDSRKAPTIADVVACAERGDAQAIAALDDAGSALGVALAGVVNILDVPSVVLGGVFAPLSTWLAPAVQRELDARVLAARWSAPTVRASALAGRAAVRGAAEAALDVVRNHPARLVAVHSTPGKAVPA